MNILTGGGQDIYGGKCVKKFTKADMQCQLPTVWIFICFSPRREQQLLEGKLLVEGESILRVRHLSIKYKGFERLLSGLALLQNI